MQALHQENDIQIFSSRPYLVFYFMGGFFETQKFLILVKSILLIVLLMSYLCLTQRHKDFSLMFSSSSFSTCI